MKKAVMYGAGNIGRGFIGQLLYESGFSTTFVDINDAIINALNRDGRYPIRIVSNEHMEERVIENICGVLGTNTHDVVQAVSECDVLFTAVGVNVLPMIAPNIAEGIAKRAESERKLGKNDRFMGAIRLCEKHGIDPIFIKIGVACALLFGEKYEVENIMTACIEPLKSL